MLGNEDRIAKMSSSSLDWSIQSALSSLYPPFEATAPTVLSQLFRTIEAHYQGDALQCYLDYLIPAKHILESVQQAACAEYSDVLFRCEGWPLCLRERVVIQLAPINPLLLRPGDFYLQVEPFGEQLTRIVLKNLLHEDILIQEDSVLLPSFRAQEGPAVEETPIPETSYPCIFTEAWLKEINDGRDGIQLHQCVLSSDQGIVKVPWAEVINPEFLDRPKAQVEVKKLCTTEGLIQHDTFKEKTDSQFPVTRSYSKTLEPDTIILPGKCGVASSHRLVKSSNKFVKMEKRKHFHNRVGKPVGWVSPNMWDNRPSRELEGDYVDLLDFAKEKEALNFKLSVIPSVQVSFRPHSPLLTGESTQCVQASGTHCVSCSVIYEDPQTGSESKGRHRQSYLAALKNPVSFEKASIIVPLNKTWPGLGEAEPGYEAQEVELGMDSLSNSSMQGSNQLEQNKMQPCPDSDKEDQNVVQINVNPILQFQETLLPGLNTAEQSRHFLIKKNPSSPPKTVLEHTGQENAQMWSNGTKHHKTQHLPKMGLRALPDHRSYRQETSAMERKIDQLVYCLAPPQKSLEQSTGQKPSLIPHKSLNKLHEQNIQFEQRPKYENRQPLETPVLALKGLVKRPKARSASSVSESAKEFSQKEKPANRSCSDVCPEIIPMVPGVQVQRSKKCTTFGIVSPKLDRRKSAKSDLPATALQNGTVLQSVMLHNLSAEHENQFSALAHDSTIKKVLQMGIICLPGSRDRAGRAVLEVHGKKNGWTSSLLSPLVLCKLILYLHSIPRKQVRELGLTVVVIINSRNGSILPMLYKALSLVQEQSLYALHSVFLLVDKDHIPREDKPPGLQVDIITSIKSLQKSVEGHQLTSEIGGSFPYNHIDWLQFYQKLFCFELELQGTASLLQNAIKNLDSNKKIDTAEDVRRCSQEQKTAMKQVLEDSHMVNLQRDSGAILARMQKEECRFAHSEDYRDSVKAVMCLYNQVEEGVHTLVMRSNQSLEYLDHVLVLRETEEQLDKTRQWCEEEARRWLDPGEETMEILKQELADIHSVLNEAKEREEKAMSLIKDVERKIHGKCYPETDIFHIHIIKFKTNLAAFIVQTERDKSDLEAVISLFHFCEQSFSLSKECSQYLEHMEKNWYAKMFNTDKLKSFQERFKAFSPERFEKVKSKTATKKHHRVGCLWTEAYSISQEVKHRLEEKLLEFDKKQKLQRFSKKDDIMLENILSQPHKSSISTPMLANVKIQSQLKAQIEIQDQDRQTRSQSTSENTDTSVKFSREHHSEADLRNVDLFDRSERNRALGRSYSEGSCIKPFSAMLPESPLTLFHKIATIKQNELLADRECVAYFQDNFCSEFCNIKPEMDNREKPYVPEDDNDSSVSRQQSFCSSVSNPRQGWMKDEKSSRIYLKDYPPRDSLTTPERLKDILDGNTDPQLENCSNLLKLEHIMEELLQTEREYVRALGYVMEHYFPEIERQDVPQDLRGQRGSIFGNLEKLREFHQHHFLNELELCLRHPFRVGRCFLRHKESFSLYAHYSKNKPRSDYLLVNHGKDFFKQKQQLLGDKMDLSSYLLKPVQRISKYSLLLQDMLQECDATPQKTSARAELQAALEVIQFQLRHGNNLLAMDDIQECDVNLKEQGQLIYQDEFLVSFRKKKFYRHIFLFQDLILFSKTKKTEVGNDMYIYKQSFKTSDIGMTRNCGDSGLCFEIWFRRRKSQDTYILQAKSYEVKEDWTKALERILWDQAIHNREIRMQERVFMGIGCKPFMDIKPSEAAICNRAINCAITGKDCKASAFTGMSNYERGFPFQRPNSTGSSSYVSSCSHSSSSSSSGRGSVSPVGYHVGLNTEVVSVSDPGRLSKSEEHIIGQENVRQNNFVDSSESSAESISGFSGSGYSLQSVMVGEHEVDPLDVSDTGLGKSCTHITEGHQQHKDKSNKPQNPQRDQPLKIDEKNCIGRSTEV